MTVATYLQRISDNAIIRDVEKDSIRTSISTVQTKLSAYFGNDIKEQFIFGSYTRGTILPRSMDEHSDIDYMVVFKDDGVKPQAYLDRLRRFVEKYYSNSEIKQSHPTIQLKLNHIMFELVPAQKSWWSGYKIPSRKSGVDDWIDTDPNDFNQSLTDKNIEYNSVIKPLIRLMKYWNAQNGYIFDSFSLEKWIVHQTYYGHGLFSKPDLKQCLFQCFGLLGSSDLSQANANKVNRAKITIERVKLYEMQQQFELAELEIKPLLPDPAASVSTSRFFR